jgi:hypothetical protein
VYTVQDIIEKLILIEQDGTKIYTDIADKFKESNPMLSILAKAFAKEEARHAQYYVNLKKEIKNEEEIEIDFHIYDQVAKLLYEYRNRLMLPELKEVRELIKYSLEFERKNIGLLLDIQGRLVTNPQDLSKARYEIFSKIIQEEREREKKLEKYLAISGSSR